MKNINEQLTTIDQILGKKKGEKNHVGRKNPKQVDRYIWKISDEMLAIYLYKKNATDKEIKETIDNTEIKFNSMKMKISNVRFLDTGEGLKNCSESLKTLWGKL